MNLAAHLVLALVTVAIAGHVVGRLCRLIGQPPVIGQVLAGILLGPTFLGAAWPAAFDLLLPASILPALGVVAELGVVLYMFVVGLELDTRALRGEARTTVAIALGSLLVPFVLGVMLAAALPSALVPPGVAPVLVSSFFGIAMTIVAFPVLARILEERGLAQTTLGIRALAVAAISDVVIWCALAVVVGARAAAPSGALASLGPVAFLAGAFVLGRPVVRSAVRRMEHAPSVVSMGVALTALAATTWLGHAVGVHRFIAAFLLGAIVPHDHALARRLTARLSAPVAILLLPAFFAFIGLKTEIGLVDGLSGWLWTGLIIVVAAAGKIGGTVAAARLVGLPLGEATTLGILMNTRGLMELVVLDLGLLLGLVTPVLFAMMVVMALVTTMMTAPLLAWSTTKERQTSGRR